MEQEQAARVRQVIARWQAFRQLNLSRPSITSTSRGPNVTLHISYDIQSPQQPAPFTEMVNNASSDLGFLLSLLRSQESGANDSEGE